MRTAGQMLKDARLGKRLDLVDISRITKIRSRFLELIEADDYQRLPSGAVAKGFIKNYSEFLGLDPDKISAIFRRDFVENEAGQIVPRGVAQPVNPTFFWSPRSTITALVITIFVLFAAYIFYQYRLLVGPPPLKLNYPPPDLTTTETTVEIRGVTDPEATISVNNQLISKDKGGRFSLRLPLASGSNSITVVSTAKSGKTSTLSRTVFLTTSP